MSDLSEASTEELRQELARRRQGFWRRVLGDGDWSDEYGYDKWDDYR